MTSSLAPSEQTLGQGPTPGLERVVAGLPELVAALMLGMSVSVAVTMLLQVYRPSTTGLIGLLLGVALALMTWSRLPARPADAVPTGVAAGLVMLLAVPNSMLRGEQVIVERDPGFYTILARWMTTDSSPRIPIPADAFPGTAGLSDSAAGFYAIAGDWYVQGNHLIPGIVALLGPVDTRLGLGGTLLLAGNVLLGAIALFLVFGFARLLVGAWWGLLPVAVLGLSMPWEYFTRSIFSEPLTAGFAASAATFLVLAARTGSIGFTALSGAFAGASATARIDGGLIIGLLLPLAALMLASATRSSRQWLVHGTAFVLPAAAMVALGYLDLAVHSPIYLIDLGGQFRYIRLLWLAAVASSLAILALARSSKLRLAVARGRRSVAIAAAIAVVALSVAMVARPWYWQGRFEDPEGGQGKAIARLQKAEGLPVDGARSFDEQSVSWIAWYFGWVLLAAAVCGLAWAAWRAIQGPDWAMASLVVLGLGIAVLYLNRVSITPDQVWAMRRLLPVVLPALALAAAVALREVSLRGRTASVLAAMLATSLLAFPVWVSRGVYPTPEDEGQAAQLEQVCDATQGGRVIVPDPALSVRSIVAITVWCGVPTLGIADPAPEILARSRDASDRPLYLLSGSPDLLAWADEQPPAFSTATIQRWERRLAGPPRASRPIQRSWWLAEVGSDGLARPLDSASMMQP